MAQLPTLSSENLAFLNGARAGSPIVPQYKATAVGLGTRLNEVAKVTTGTIVIGESNTSGTLALGTTFAGAKCVASIAAKSGGSSTGYVVSAADANASGGVVVTLNAAPGGGETTTVNVWADAR